MRNLKHLLFVTLLLAACSAAPNPTASPTPLAEVTPPAPATGELTAKLDGLSFDQFLEVSHRELLLRSPETVISAGLAEVYGLEEVSLDNISDDTIRETYAMRQEVLHKLRTYDRESLTPEQQLSYDIYEWYLDDLVRQQEFMYNDYPASFMITTSIPLMTYQFFAEVHPIASKQDAKDYVTRLSLVKTKFDQLIDGLELREQVGALPPRFALEWTLYTLGDLASGPAQSSPFYTIFEEKLGAVSGLSEDEKQALLADAGQAIEESVLPAYQAVLAHLQSQLSAAPQEGGVWQFENGDSYYAYLLRHYTSTDMTPDEIHQLGLQELDRIQAEMRAIFDERGYPADESLLQLYGRVISDCGTVPGDQAVARYEEIIDETEQRLGEAFDLFPQTGLIVVGDPGAGDAYYLAGSFDGSRPGTFHASVGRGAYTHQMHTLTYHEGIPGHHLQISLNQEMDLPSFRRGSEFLGYVEGWALYAERLAWDLGWYEGDSCSNLGRLQYEAFRAARLVVDTGIHAEGWTFGQAQDFFVENTGYDEDFAQTQIGRYEVWPGQSTAYMIGMLKILELRQRAMDQLGDRFDLKEFHHVVLGSGAMPLDVLERVVDDYIVTKLNG